jgi:TRAP-type transport system periplasmic protein
MKKIIYLGFAALLGFSAMASTAMAADFKWRLQVYEPPSSITTQLLLRMANEVRKRTEGGLSIDIYQPGVLGYSGWGVHRAVSTKQLEMAEGITAAITEIPAYGIFNQPFFTNISEAKVVWDLIKSDLDKSAQEKMGLKLLSGVAKPMGYWIAKKPMATANDIQGMKIRTWNLALSKWAKKMGGVPHSIPYAELYTSLASGVVEANASSPVSVIEAKLFEVAKYFNMWPSGIVVFATFVNLDKFNALPAGIQKILMEEADKAETENWKLQAAAAAPAIEKMQKLGVTIVRPSAEELAKGAAADKAIYEEWLAEAPADVKALAKSVLKTLGK